MSWTHCVSDIPMNDWAFFRRIHAVTVGHRVYLFDYNKCSEGDAIQVLIFNSKTCTCNVIQSVCGKEGSIKEIVVPRGEIVLIHFAVAFEEKVYVCIGGRATSNARELHAFDTRSLRWSCVTTSGDVPSGYMRWRVCACEEDGHLYVCAVNSTSPRSEGTHLWALEMNSLRWKIVANGGWSDRCIPRCVVPYKNRIYVLLERLEFPSEFTDDEIMYFDLATRTWERLQPPGTTPFTRQLWLPFVHREFLYVFLDEKLMRHVDEWFGNVNLSEVVLRYSFAENYWEQVWFKGMSPVDTLNLASVVDNTVVFFSFNRKKAYVLDFFPSLRSLCFQVVSKYELDPTLLPALLKNELSMYKYRIGSRK